MVYIYEYIRTQGFEPIHFEEHYAHLDMLSVVYFSESLKISQHDLRKAIKESLRKGHFSPTSMNVVYVRYFADGTFELEADYMIYSAFAMRALRPKAHLLRLSGEMLTHNTSAKEALVEFYHTAQQQQNGANNDVFIWADEKDEVVAIDGSPVIAVFEDEVRFSHKGSGVEFELAYDVVANMNRNATKGAINLAELAEAKELLYISHEGITAVKSFRPEPESEPTSTLLFMDISAEKFASKIAEAEV